MYHTDYEVFQLSYLFHIMRSLSLGDVEHISVLCFGQGTQMQPKALSVK